MSHIYSFTGGRIAGTVLLYARANDTTKPDAFGTFHSNCPAECVLEAQNLLRAVVCCSAIHSACGSASPPFPLPCGTHGKLHVVDNPV